MREPLRVLIALGAVVITPVFAEVELTALGRSPSRAHRQGHPLLV